MNKIGFLFPGQGAQTVGMGRDLYEESPEARSVFDQADAALDYSISKLCFEGPEEKLTRTVHAQVSIFVTSLAALSALRLALPQIRPHLACGLSLGEFTALVALESISFTEGLKLVERRGELMEEASQRRPGMMASILGLELEDVESVCQETGAEVANLNGPQQLVISGPTEIVEQACALAKERGAKRAVPLKVGGAFHSTLMEHARSGLEDAIADVHVNVPKGIFIPNVLGYAASSPKDIRSLLAKQLTSPVQWTKSMETVNRMGVKELLEIGPGHVLKGLAKKIDSSLNVTNIGTRKELENWSSHYCHNRTL